MRLLGQAGLVMGPIIALLGLGLILNPQWVANTIPSPMYAQGLGFMVVAYGSFRFLRAWMTRRQEIAKEQHRQKIQDREKQG